MGAGRSGGRGWESSGWGSAGNGTTDVTWDNKAAVRVTAGFDEKTWTSANYVAKITGLLYNDLTGARACHAMYRERAMLCIALGDYERPSLVRVAV